ncbi:hypothetical protein [Aliivibrio wodanis]|uniref:hypothetical protein n=1 Tax=Aliivibrio wodanis TaxID=80852 RepID=UPI00406CB7C6
MKQSVLLPVMALLSFSVHAELINISYDFSDEHQYQSSVLLPTSEPWELSTVVDKQVITQWESIVKGDFTPIYHIVSEGVNITAKPIDNEQATYQFDIQYFPPATITTSIDSVSGFEVSTVKQDVTSFTETITLIDNKPVCNSMDFCVTLITDYPDEETGGEIEDETESDELF